MIPKPKIPTDKEMAEIAVRKYEEVGMTFLDNIPSEVMKFSPKTNFTEATSPSDILPVFDGDKHAMKILIECLKPLFVGDSFSPKFFKLSSRSPKETHDSIMGIATWSAEQAAYRFSVSERCLDDYALFSYHPSYKLKFCARKFLEPVIGSEIRVFVKNGEIAAMAAYEKESNYFDEIVFGLYSRIWDTSDAGKNLYNKIRDFWNTSMKSQLSHMSDYVFDYCVGWERYGTPLIEINPYGLSDPCGFLSYENVENYKGYIKTW